jgi:hypothetical protein
MAAKKVENKAVEADVPVEPASDLLPADAPLDQFTGGNPSTDVGTFEGVELLAADAPLNQWKPDNWGHVPGNGFLGAEPTGFA